ncbi:MAG: sce7726 family protein [Solobacterium sp.]|nr:sce7726 family protein [Solobacterium sp.]
MTLLDKDIREPLFQYLEERYGLVRILEEKEIGQSRADAVMVTADSLYGIEIKSDADTYARLSSQVKDYDQYYDFNYVVAGSTHGLHVAEHVPWYWGIITVEWYEDRVDFYLAREPERNPHMDLRRKLSLLWRPELVRIQEKHKLPKYKEKSKLFVQKKILEKVSPQDLQADISNELFERDYTKIKETINEYRRARGRRARRKPPKRRRL